MYSIEIRITFYEMIGNANYHLRDEDNTVDYIQGVPEVLERFREAISQEPWDYRNGMGAKRCASSLSFVWELSIYEKKCFCLFWCL
jgi:hypothetical protein